MNIYARIRKIEDDKLFKRFFNTLLGAEYKEKFQTIKEWKDCGVDGYLKDEKRVYAVYCPTFPERTSQKKYKTKISSDIKKLKKAVVDSKISLGVESWVFVTPDDLSTEIIDHIHKETRKCGWNGSSLTSYVLAALFMKHKKIRIDFPEIASALESDKLPSIDAKMVKNKSYKMVEIFNDGTEDIKELKFEINRGGEVWQVCNDNFFYETDNPVTGRTHTCVTIKKGERQLLESVPIYGNFHIRVTGIGVESQKTFNKEFFIPPTGKEKK